jgi:lipoprotein-releasing system permease protein
MGSLPFTGSLQFTIGSHAKARACGTLARIVMRPYELFIGLRYTRSRHRSRFISFISLISIIAIALGIMVLITVLSVMNGFQREIRTRILDVAAHVQITGANDLVNDWQRVAVVAAKNPEVLAGAPYVSQQALLTNGSAVRGAYIRGVLPEYEDKVEAISQHMVAGRLDDLKPGEFGMVLGIDLARALGVFVGDKVTVVAPEGQVTPVGVMPRLRRFTVVGIFRIDHYEFDSGLALINLQDAQKLYRMGATVSGVRLKLRDLFRSSEVVDEMSRALGFDYVVTDWTQQYSNFFRAVDIEKRMMFLIVFLIIIVAAFNIVSSLFMGVKDKQPDIAILRTLGASPKSITAIFLIQGTLIGVIGTVAGVVAGIALAANVETIVPALENLLGFKFLAKDVYYISELPSELRASDVVLTALFSFIVCVLATIYPSWRAAKINPAEALRYE